MEYNILITHYADNKQSVRIYKNQIHSDDDVTAEIAENREISKQFNKENGLEPDKDWSDYVSKNRTINSIYQYGRSYIWEYFITLTFNPDRVNRYDFYDCMHSASKYFEYVKRNFSRDLDYLLVPEKHKDGAWHIHGVITNTNNLPISDSGKVDSKGQIIYNLPTFIYGFTTATKVTNSFAVSAYITKYITKELSTETKNRKRYIISNGLKKPVTSRFNIIR